MDGVNGTGVCKCDPGFHGTACETCVDGKYGVHCDQGARCVPRPLQASPLKVACSRLLVVLGGELHPKTGSSHFETRSP